MNKKQLMKKIEQYYWSHGQCLIIDTWEVMDGTDNDCSFDIHIVDSNIQLFTIQNYNGLRDLDVYMKNYFKTPKCAVIEKWDGVKASCIPLYFDNIITLKTFKPITKEDIIHAVDYFLHEILNEWCIFNIKFKEGEDNNGS